MQADATFEVALGTTVVGHLVRAGEGSIFHLDDEYLHLAHRPVLGQMFEDAPAGSWHTSMGVPRWFSHLLPEGALRRLIATQIGVKDVRELFLIEHLGADLPGSVVVRRVGGAPAAPDGDARPGPDPGATLKFSLAGVQLKFSALSQGPQLTIPASGMGGDWIVKLPSATHPGLPENEFATMRLAKAAGIDVPETILVNVGDIQNLPEEFATSGVAFAIRRFDREGDGQRVHVEDLAQVLDLTVAGKYGDPATGRGGSFETIARIVHALEGEAGLRAVVRRLVFNVAVGNGDAHNKNWSLIYRDGVRASLSPVYDLVSTVVYVPNDDLGLSLGGVKAFAGISDAVFARFARRAHVDEAVVLDEVRESRDAVFRAFGRLGGELPPATRRMLRDRLAAVPLFAP